MDSSIVYCFTSLGATLSIQETEITITEGTSGQICIVLENFGDGLDRSIFITLSTNSGTAGKYTCFFRVCVILSTAITSQANVVPNNAWCTPYTFTLLLFIDIIFSDLYSHFSDISDFSPLANEVLTIPSTLGASSSVCHDIIVLDDTIVEDSEIFTITVETATPNDMIMGPSTAIVTIADDDGKYCGLLSALFSCHQTAAANSSN